MSSEGFLTAGDGARLFYRRWNAAVPKAVCLLTHGIAEHSGRYEDLARKLASRGFSVRALDQRGHGRSDGAPADCTGLGQLTADLHLLVLKTAQETPSLPRVVLGHSLGGLIALAYAAEHPDQIRAVAVSSPGLKLKYPTPFWKFWLVTGTARLFPFFPFQNGVDPKQLSRDPLVVEAYVRDPRIHRTITARCAVALDRDMKNSFRLADQLRIPCLILQAGSDAVCDPDHTEAFSRSIRSAPVTFRRYDGLYHEIFNEPQKEQVIEDLVQWMEEQLK